MRLKCRTLSGEEFNVTTKPTESILQLKRTISKAKSNSTSPSKLVLVHAGEFLKDTKTVQQTNINDESLLIVSASEESLKMDNEEPEGSGFMTDMADILEEDAAAGSSSSEGSEGEATSENADFTERMQRWPHLATLRRLVTHDISLLPGILQRMAASCPRLLREMQANQVAIMRLLLDEVEEINEMRLSPAHRAAVQRLQDLGFSEKSATDALQVNEFDEEKAIRSLLMQESI